MLRLVLILILSTFMIVYGTVIQYNFNRAVGEIGDTNTVQSTSENISLLTCVHLCLNQDPPCVIFENNLNLCTVYSAKVSDGSGQKKTGVFIKQ
ncbi:Uncharacterised protein g3667 [Pycnogonum litorale]